MNILVDIEHPAHVHFFKNMIWNLEEDGHKVKIIAKDKDITIDLLDAYEFKYTKVSRYYVGMFKKAFGLISKDIQLYKIAREFRPDILTGILTPHITHVGMLIKKPSVIFTDTEHAKLANGLTFPFATIICTPTCFKNDIGKKQVRYDGYHELAYLHPNYFKPDPSALEYLGLTEDDPFIVLRFVAWEAGHDIGERGFDSKTKMQLIRKLENYGRVMITS